MICIVPRAARYCIGARGGMVESSSVKRRLTCILAADAVGYSQQMGQDEEGTIRVLSAHRAVIDGIIAFHQGRIVSTAGDSVIAEFGSAVDSVRCAVEIQDALKTRNDSLPEHRQMRFRIGVNLGDVVVKNEDLLGDGVNVAARLETMAEPGGICISSSVYDQITGKLDLGFQDIGDQSLKNISRPIRVYRVTGAGAPLRLPASVPPRPSAPAARGIGPWAIGAVLAMIIGAAVAWQTGWLRVGSTDGGSKAVAAAPVVAPPPAPVLEKGAASVVITDAGVTVTRSDAEAQRLRSEAETIKRQAEAELVRARSDAAAARVRAQAEADAARIRADAEASAARTRSEAASAVVAAAAQAPKPTPAQRDAEAKTRDPNSTAPATVESDKVSRPVVAGASRFDGNWNVTVACPRDADGASGYTLEFVAQIKDGFLRGEYGAEGAAGSLKLQGEIRADGSASLDAKGITGDRKFNVKNVASGVPYGYQVGAGPFRGLARFGTPPPAPALRPDVRPSVAALAGGPRKSSSRSGET